MFLPCLFVHHSFTLVLIFYIESGARAAVNTTFGYSSQQPANPSTNPTTSTNIGNVLSEARHLVQSLASSNRSSGGFRNSSSVRGGGAYASKYGLPFKSTKKTGKGKTPAPKIHQKRVLVLDGYGENAPEVCTMSDNMILVDGNMRYQGNNSETEIREKILELMSAKDHLNKLTADDFEFVRVCNKRIRKPDGNVPFDALGINTVYPSGAIYTRLCKKIAVDCEFPQVSSLHCFQINERELAVKLETLRRCKYYK